MVSYVSHRAQVLAELKAGIERANTRIGMVVSTTAREFWIAGSIKAFKYGNLSGSVGYRTSGGNGNLPAGSVPDMSVAVGASENYAAYVHEGTSKMPARPAIRNAIIERSGYIRQQYDGALNGAR